MSDFEGELRRTAASLLQGVPETLKNSIEYSLYGPGKRIRPRLVQSTAQALNLAPAQAQLAACALEMAHAYTLIHDDLPCMDDDDFRRGRPTNHKEYGEATALLAGDSLITLAIDAILSDSTIAPNRAVDAIRVLSEAMGARGVIAGQALEEQIRETPHPKLLERIFILKTGALFKAALLVPAALAGLYEQKETQKIIALGNYGYALGIAFQIADDLEDEPETSAKDPAHVLYHFSATEADETARKKMRFASDELARALGNASDPLLDFAREIEGKLGTA